MSKALLLSIKPKWVAEILNGEKTIEIRKTCPKQLRGDTPIKPEPIDVYIYCTKEKKEKLVHTTESQKPYKTYWEVNNTSEMLSSRNGKVVAKFTLNKVEHFEREYSSRYIDDYYGDRGEPLNKKFYKNACLTEDEIFNYIGSGSGYAWHISNLVIFDKPKELIEFCGVKQYFVGCESGIDKTPRYAQLTKAPQSWCYVETGE